MGSSTLFGCYGMGHSRHIRCDNPRTALKRFKAYVRKCMGGEDVVFLCPQKVEVKVISAVFFKTAKIFTVTELKADKRKGEKYFSLYDSRHTAILSLPSSLEIANITERFIINLPVQH